jgi:glycosyltransferase involved in cell wall biosynthesis
MHVLHLVDALALGGAERMVVEIANRTVRDHRASVCVSRTGSDLAPRLDPRVALIVLGRQRRFELRPLLNLARWCKQNEVDLLHCHGRSSFSLAATLRACRLLRIPIVFHDHRGIEVDRSVPRWFPVAARYLSQYVGVYEKQVSWARDAGVPADRIQVIPNAIDMHQVTQQPLVGPPLPETPKRARVVAIGGIRIEKAFDVLLDAVARVHAPIALYIIGGDADPAYASRCRERATRHDVRDRVTFLGPRPDALALAATADLAVHSSRSESGPIVLLEYAALALPFVATRVGGIAMALDTAGMFVPPDAPAQLTAAIDDVIAMSAPERRHLGQQLRLAARAFDIGEVIPAWYALYERTLQSVR